MEQKDVRSKFKYVVGAYSYGDTKATMEIFDDIDAWSAYLFIDEFKYLESMGVNEIDIRINSIGGSVIDGISIYSTIINSDVHCTTINEGVAMSMGSIIWAAGDVAKMRDYSILMLHNPFANGADPKDKDYQELVKYCTNMLKTIYTSRFNLSEGQVTDIMNGKDGIDGTYFTAQEAVSAGFIDESCVLTTSPIKMSDELKNELSEMNKMSDKVTVLAKFISESKINMNEKQPKQNEVPIISRKGKKPEATLQLDVNQKTNKTEKMDKEFKVLAKSLNLSEDADLSVIYAAVEDLKKEKVEREKIASELSELKIQAAAKDASIKNYESEIESLENQLGEYKTKEEEQLKAQVEALVNKALEDGRIKEDSKEFWIENATRDLKNTKQALESIKPASITNQIATDDEGLKDAAEQSGMEAKRISEQIMKARGLA